MPQNNEEGQRIVQNCGNLYRAKNTDRRKRIKLYLPDGLKILRRLDSPQHND